MLEKLLRKIGVNTGTDLDVYDWQNSFLINKYEKLFKRKPYF